MINNELINPEPFQIENASLLPAGEILSDGHFSTNEVSSVSLSNISSPRRTVPLPDYIKQEYLDDGVDNDDPSNVHLNIKTESMVCDLEVVKNEIKEEYEDDHDCGGCDRCIVKREVVSDDEEQVDNDGQVKRLSIDEVDVQDGVTRGGDNNEVDAERFEVIQPNVDFGQLLCNPSRDIQNASNENELIGVGGANLGDKEQIPNTANQSHDQTVTPSPDLFSPSTSTCHGSNRTALNEQATVSTQRNATKRKQPPLNRTVKRSKKILVEEEDGEGEEDGQDITNEDRGAAKVLVLHLNCTQSNCNAKLDSMDDLHDHLRTVHHLSPLQCFAFNCNARFDNRSKLCSHMKLHRSPSTRYLCPACHQQFDSQTKTYRHWYRHHLNGQFKCNYVSDCVEVTDTRNKMRTHQRIKHEIQLEQFQCTYVGCSASFAYIT